MDITVTHTSTTLARILTNAKSNIDKLNKSGVYQISCDQCAATYIGQTQRGLKYRLKEHLRTTNDKSAFAQHLREKGHTCNMIENTKLLHQETKLQKQLL